MSRVTSESCGTPVLDAKHSPLRRPSRHTTVEQIAGISVMQPRTLNMETAKRIIEEEHGQSWFQFSEQDHPEAVSCLTGNVRVNTNTMLIWLGY